MSFLNNITAYSTFASRSFDLVMDYRRQARLCMHDFGLAQGTSPLNSSGDSLSGGGENILAQWFVFFEGLRAFPLPGSGC